MTVRERSIMVNLAKGMTSRNGYRPMQSSDRYINDGSFPDWAFGVYGIPSLTMELAPKTAAGGGFYPRGSRIAALVAQRPRRAPVVHRPGRFARPAGGRLAALT